MLGHANEIGHIRDRAYFGVYREPINDGSKVHGQDHSIR